MCGLSGSGNKTSTLVSGISLVVDWTLAHLEVAIFSAGRRGVQFYCMFLPMIFLPRNSAYMVW